MVINSEDKVREYNFLVKKYQSDEARTYATMLDIQNLQARNQFKVQSFDYRSQFLQKLTKFAKKYQKFCKIFQFLAEICKICSRESEKKGDFLVDFERC